jgi:hypothetical protein
MAAWPAGDRTSVLVFIVDGDIGDIAQSFAAFVEADPLAVSTSPKQAER